MQLQWIHQTLIITNSTHATLDDLFSALFISRKTRFHYYQNQCITINHTIIKQNTPLQVTDRIALHELPQHHEEHMTPSFTEIDICYEDDLLLIVNKPPHMIVHSDGTGCTTLYDLVAGYYILQGYTCPVRAIHRLDRQTSGVVIFCKIPLLQPLLDQMLKEKRIARRYYALCDGIIDKDHIAIDAPIGKDRHHSNQMRISHTGKEAHTDVYVLSRHFDFTYVECQLQQGRTHQIRVHLASINHPILSDSLYGNQDQRITRLALHAHCVQLYHPLLQKDIQIECPLPKDIKDLLI